MPKRRNENAPYWQQLREAERRIIEYALEHGQTLRGTASILGISPNYLSERTRELGIAVPEVRPGPKPGTKPTRPVKPELRVVADDPPADTGPAEDEDEGEVLEDEVEEGDEDEGDEGDPWEEGDEAEDADDNNEGQVPDANHDAAEGN